MARVPRRGDARVSSPRPVVERLYAKDRLAFRRWLQRHHARSRGVWLVSYKKKTGKPSIPYAEAVEEALAFGWVDSRPNFLDEERFQQLFSPRKPKSPWSRLNKERVAKLIETGRMMPAGLAKVEAAKRDGSWSTYDGVEALRVPADLRRALSANAAARRNVEAFSPSSKKIILWWVTSAKRPETRAKRVAETVRLAAKNLKANHWRQ